MTVDIVGFFFLQLSGLQVLNKGTRLAIIQFYKHENKEYERRYNKTKPRPF